MTIRERAAIALDLTHEAAGRRVGIHTDKMRDHLAAYLDGTLKLTAKQVRIRCKYLEGVAR